MDAKEDYFKVVASDLDDLLQFINKYSTFVNLNSNDFLIGDHWNKFLPNKFFISTNKFFPHSHLNELQSHESAEFNVVKSSLFSHFKNADEFVQEAVEKTLPNLKSLLTFDAVTQELGNTSSFNKKANIREFMSIKKSYEVEIMGNLCNVLASFGNLKNVVDIGSGLGYLGCYLSLAHGLNVLGIDSEPRREITAKNRNTILKNRWRELVKNDCNKDKFEPPENNDQIIYTNSFETCSFVPICECVTNQTQITNLFDNNFNKSSHYKPNPFEKIMFTSLHTCGNLSSDVIRLFVESDKASVLCLVGCCYNLLTEEFSISDSHDNYNELKLTEPGSFGFPVSDFLRSKFFKLGANARSLASQSLDRVTAEDKIPSDSLFWRALLQVILVDKLGQPKSKTQWRVGKISTKCHSFHEYFSRAIKKLQLNLQLTEKEISDYYLKYISYKTKCLAFYQLRTYMGAVIESLIHLDRLMFLLEQKSIKKAFIIQMFNPVISPRCYALIALK